MPKRKNTVPQARLHKPSGQARVRVDGREIYLSPFGSAEARRRYAEFLADWQARRAAGAPMAPAAPVTISIAVWRFWQWSEGRYRHADGTSTREHENYRLALRPLRRLFGDLPISEFGPGKLYEVQTDMIDSGLARKTVNSRMARIRRFFRWCVGREICPASMLTALSAVEPVKLGQGVREAPARRPVAWATVEATLPHLPPLLRALVLVLWHTGARVGEVATLTTSRIDTSGDVWRETLDEHKNAWRGQARVLLLGPEAQEALRPWLRPDEPDEPIFSPRRSTPKAAVKGGARAPGWSYSRHSLPQAIRRACDKAFPHPALDRIPPDERTEEQAAELARWRKGHQWSLAQLRHSAATRIRERFGIDVAAAVLGHAKPTMTAHYSKEALSHAEAALRLVG